MNRVLAKLTVAVALVLTGIAAIASVAAQAPDVVVADGRRSQFADTGPRLALVVANGFYPGLDKNVARAQSDRALVGAALHNAGFAVEFGDNLSRADLTQRLVAFRERSRRASVALVYFVGAGFEVDGASYIAGVDADLRALGAQSTAADLKEKLVDTADLVEAVRMAQNIGIVMVDAGRSDPWARQRGFSLGGAIQAARNRFDALLGWREENSALGQAARASDMLMFFSADAGADPIESDPAQPNGPFARAVAQHIGDQGVEIEIFGRRVRAAVLRETRQKQRPTSYGELSDREFYFTALAPQIAVQASPPRPLVLSSQPRLALVFGNGDYNRDNDYADDRNSTPVQVEGFAPDLPNTINDAADIHGALLRLRFQVDRVENGDRAAVTAALFAFEKKVKAAGRDAIVVVYYAGHAIQVGGANYLVPVGAKLPALDYASMSEPELEDALTQYAVPINTLYERLRTPSSKGLNLVILDACRENPWESRGIGRSVAAGGGGPSRGLADIRIQLRRTAIAYATKPGDIAADGDGRNSPYTTVLKSWIERPGLTVRDLFDGVAGEVEQATGERQSPWINTPALGGTCLGPCPQ